MTDSTDNAQRIWLQFSDQGELISVSDEPLPGHTSWIRRADLAPDPLADPRVMALVEALQSALAEPSRDVSALWVPAARAALAALSPTGGNADG